MKEKRLIVRIKKNHCYNTEDIFGSDEFYLVGNTSIINRYGTGSLKNTSFVTSTKSEKSHKDYKVGTVHGETWKGKYENNKEYTIYDEYVMPNKDVHIQISAHDLDAKEFTKKKIIHACSTIHKFMKKAISNTIVKFLFGAIGGGIIYDLVKKFPTLFRASPEQVQKIIELVETGQEIEGEDAALIDGLAKDLLAVDDEVFSAFVEALDEEEAAICIEVLESFTEMEECATAAEIVASAGGVAAGGIIAAAAAGILAAIGILVYFDKDDNLGTKELTLDLDKLPENSEHSLVYKKKQKIGYSDWHYKLTLSVSYS